MAADQVLDEMIANRGKRIRLGLGVVAEVDGFAVQQKMPDRKPKQDRRIQTSNHSGPAIVRNDLQRGLVVGCRADLPEYGDVVENAVRTRRRAHQCCLQRAARAVLCDASTEWTLAVDLQYQRSVGVDPHDVDLLGQLTGNIDDDRCGMGEHGAGSFRSRRRRVQLIGQSV